MDNLVQVLRAKDYRIGNLAMGQELLGIRNSLLASPKGSFADVECWVVLQPENAESPVTRFAMQTKAATASNFAVTTDADQTLYHLPGQRVRVEYDTLLARSFSHPEIDFRVFVVNDLLYTCIDKPRFMTSPERTHLQWASCAYNAAVRQVLERADTTLLLKGDYAPAIVALTDGELLLSLGEAFPAEDAIYEELARKT